MIFKRQLYFERLWWCRKQCRAFKKLQLERKPQIISKLVEQILEETENKGEITNIIETTEEVHSKIANLKRTAEKLLQQRSRKKIRRNN